MGSNEIRTWATSSRKDPRFNLCGLGSDAKVVVCQKEQALGCKAPDDLAISFGSVEAHKLVKNG